MTWTKNTRSAASDDRGLPAWAFAGLMLAAFTIVAACALVGGSPGLLGIVATAVIAIAFAATRL
ncbi:hypothetical protein ACFWM5_40810 [Streptomyces bobili]|uniref:hypothetical protein n=1 Tax=Streptomyces bobili TaxID=67280 RepID=UPI003649EEE3